MRLSRVIATISLVAGTGVAVVLSWPQDSRGTPGPRPVETSQPIASTSADCSPHHAAAHDRAAAADEIAQVLTEEHGAALRLTELCEATHVATKSGRWSDPRTWSTREVPDHHSKVFIPAGTVVDVDGVFDRRALDWIRVDGRLVFQLQRKTALLVRTVVVSDSGALTIGSAAQPLHPRATARLLFAPRDVRDRRRDPLDLAGGLISSGVVEMVGPPKDGRQFPTTMLRGGTMSLEFAAAPVGWNPGDRLLIPGTVYGNDQDELRTITARSADGRVLTLDRPLRFHHAGPEGVPVPVANMTRNIEIASADPEPLAARGHVMIMHVQTGTTFDGVAFLHLGRTDARFGHTHPAAGPDGATRPLTDANSAGRYPVHFHIRSGARRTVAPHVIRNSVVVDSPKYGIVNHGGHVLAEGNVTFRVVGAHLVAENGSEIGAFRGNMAVRSAGSGDTPIQSRMNIYDLGHAGHGVWLQGFGVELTDNWASGHADTAIVGFGNPFYENGEQVLFDARNLVARDQSDGPQRVGSADVDLHMARNTVAGSKQGLMIWTHKLDSADMDGSVIEDLTVWNVKGAHYAVLLAYTQHVVVRNARLVGSGDRGQVGIGGNMFTGSVTIEGGSIVGFADGIQVPSRGRNAVRNTVLANNTDLVIGTANYRDRYVHLDNPVFRNASDPRHVNIRMNDLEVPHNGDMAMIFLDDRIDLTDGRGNNQRVFFPSQHPDSVPFPTDGVDALRGLSSEDIQRRFSIAPGGALAPPAATVLPRSNALAVAAAPFSQPAQAFAPERRAGEGYSLQFDHFSRAAAETLASGWTVAGSSADASPAALIFVDKTPPKFMLLNCLVPPQIHPDDVPFGYRVMGMVIDKVGDRLSAIAHGQTFRNLKIDADGRVRLSFEVSDMAGNDTSVDLALEVTSAAVRRGPNLEFFLQKKYCADSGIDSVQADARRFYETGEWRLDPRP